MPLTAEDHFAIRNTQARYCHAIDTGDADGWASVFTEDCVFEESFADQLLATRLVGREAVREFARVAHEMIPHMRCGRHWTSNHVIEGDGDEATSVSFVMFVSSLDEGSVIVNGIYRDVLRRVEGKWLLAKREALLDTTAAQAEERMLKLARLAAAAGKAANTGKGSIAYHER